MSVFRYTSPNSTEKNLTLEMHLRNQEYYGVFNRDSHAGRVDKLSNNNLERLRLGLAFAAA